MSEHAGPPPDSVIALLALDVAALVVCLVATVSDVSPWLAFWVGLGVVVIAGIHWFWLKDEGRFHPMATSAWALGFSSLAWSIGLVAAAA